MKTLKSSIDIEGTGLMSGLGVSLSVKPSAERGIFFTIDGVKIPATLENVVSTEHCVVLGTAQNNKTAKVALVEHFMAACAICGLDGVDVAFHSPVPELPALDGSAKVWVEKFNEAGFCGDEEPEEPLEGPIMLNRGKSSIVLLPSSEPTNIVYAVNFDHPDLRQRWADSTNMDDITQARTFGYLKDLEAFQAAGFSKGVTIDNTVGLTENGYTTALRCELEPIKHKILDIIGDLYLTGINPLKLGAKIIAKEAGHTLHVEAARMLKAVRG
jgi:UDP-3-O-[3-hydroxymyristoyl] N-acetylglucosamine deacetylase